MNMTEFRLKKWNFSTNKLVEQFAKKYFGEDIDSYWVADDIGGVYFVNDYFFNLNDIITALKFNATFDQLVDYYDLSIEAYQDKTTIANFENYIKYGIEKV